MSSIADGTVHIQTTSESLAAPPSWFGEVVLIAAYLHQHGVLTKISEQMRFARRRFGYYEVIDFLAVLFGYAISGERTLEAFYERLQPFAIPFMALFERDRLPSRSALSRFLAALTEAPVEALRTLFLDDLLARPLTLDKQTGGLVDRAGNAWVVFDIDGTREAARQRALPQTDELPSSFRRLDDVCAPGYRGRKRGEVVRTRTTVSQAHSYQWLGSFGNRGNGRYREELRQGISAIGRYLTAHHLPLERTLLRLDGQYGNGAVLSDVAGFVFVTRGKDYRLLDHPLIQARLHLPPDQLQQRPESPMVRSLYDCPEIPVGPEGTFQVEVFWEKRRQRQELAAMIMRKCIPSLILKEKADVLPRSIIGMETGSVKSLCPLEQSANLRISALERRHRACREQRNQPSQCSACAGVGTARSKRDPTAARVVSGCAPQTGSSPL
jgi:hypothetical protein